MNDEPRVVGFGCPGFKPVVMRPSELQAIRDAHDAHKAQRASKYPDEKSAVREIFECFQRLKELGWREATYAPRDRSGIEVIEAGSTGIHSGYRDDIGFWVTDDEDTYPSHPILWRASLRESGKEEPRG